ncbi:hypothetical protein TNCV_3769101 [Trichonephila clavipes]|nr:hypothetical protein TNCV_3769101 [Trichonephila clavipes]
MTRTRSRGFSRESRHLYETQMGGSKTHMTSVDGSCDWWTNIVRDEDLVTQISEAAARVREIPGNFECELQSPHRRCQTCISTGGRKYEQLL